MKIKAYLEELNSKSVAELKDELVTAKKELFNLKIQNSTNQLDNTSRIREVRKNIARKRELLSKDCLMERRICCGKGKKFKENAYRQGCQ